MMCAYDPWSIRPYMKLDVCVCVCVCVCMCVCVCVCVCVCACKSHVACYRVICIRCVPFQGVYINEV